MARFPSSYGLVETKKILGGSWAGSALFDGRGDHFTDSRSHLRAESRLAGAPSETERPRPILHASQLEWLVSWIESVREGAFPHFMQRPWVRAVLVPITGYGGLTLIEVSLRYFR